MNRLNIKINSVLLIVFTLLLAINVAAQKQDKMLKVYLGNKQFYDPTLGNYVEFQLHFEGHTLNYIPTNEGLLGEVVVIMDIKSGDSIVVSDAYRLKSPVMRDSIFDDFYDVKRFALNPGDYTLAIELKDFNSENESIKATKKIQVEDFSKNIHISDIQVSEIITKGDENSVFYKSGFNLIPKVVSVFPEEYHTIPVYLEVYNTHLSDDSVFALKQYIYDWGNEVEVEAFTKVTRFKSVDVFPIINSVDISLLSSGNYELNYVVLNRSMQEITRTGYLFDRINTIEKYFNPNLVLIDPAFQLSITDDSVAFYLASLIPIANQGEVKNILKILRMKNDSLSRKQIQGFWNVTAGANNYEEWMKYKAQVQLVQRIYSNSYQAGFETDRGRVYLQYGPPTTLIQRDVSSTEYPYEIWQYNKIGRFSNKRFVFYNPDLVSNGYRLLHSDMIGELKNDKWQYELNKRNTVRGTIDNPNEFLDDSYGSDSYDLFRQY
jgi:GWxTD domain-containing protein